MDKHGQMLLAPQITLEGWWTDLNLLDDEVIALYRDHATSEQFHSEFKTDLDLERLASGKFATNALVMALGAFAYNILRVIGQMGLLGQHTPIRHPAKRRRIRTVIQELIYLAARLISTGRRLKLRVSVVIAQPLTRSGKCTVACCRLDNNSDVTQGVAVREKCALFPQYYRHFQGAGR